jgi:hypothetical protein
MNNEFKKSKSNNETRYTLESMTAGATGSGSVATAPSSLGKVQKRGNILAQEAGKDKVPATTPRNFVAKNAKSSGAGAHKDKKKEQKQGAAKHKKPYMESLRTKIDQLKSKLAEAGMPFRGVGGAFNRGDDERHDLDPTDWYVVKDGKMFKTSVYPNQVQLAIAQGYSRTRDEAKAKAEQQGVEEGGASMPGDQYLSIPADQTKLSIGQQMAQDGITYSPDKEDELIGLMAQYMKKAGMSSKQIRYLLSYDEDYIPDQLSDLPKQGVAEAFGSSSVNMPANAAGTDGHQQSIDFYNQEVDNLAVQADPEFQEWIEAAEEKLVAAIRNGKDFTHLAKVLSAQQVKKFGGKTLGQQYGSQMAGKADAYYTSEIRNILNGPVTNAGNEMTRRHELSLQLQTIRSGWRRMSPEDKQNLADQVGYSLEELEHFVKTGQDPEEGDLRESVKQVRPATPDELRTGYTASKSHAVGADGNVYYFMDPKLKQVGLLRNKKQGVAEATGDERFDSMMGQITGGAGARQGVDNLNKSLTARTGSDPETALAKFGQEFIKWLEDLCREFAKQGADRFNKLKKLSEFEDGGETMAHWLIDVAKQTKTSGITLADIQEFSSEFNTHGMWAWQMFPIAWSQNEWQDYKDQWTGPNGYIANLRHSPEQGVAEGSGANKTHLAMAYLKAVVMAPIGTPEKRRILNWQQILSNQFDIEMDPDTLAQMLPQFDSQLQSGNLDKLQNRMASRGELEIGESEQGVAEAPEDRTSYQVAKILSDRGIKYDPAQENELINAIGMVLVKELNMSPKEARYLISYDEDFVSDTLGELRSMEQSVSEVDVYMESLAHSLQQVLSEKAVSKKQQKFMGMVHAAQKGEKPASKEVAKTAKDMGKKDARDFASTKHKGLPEKKKSKK